VLAFTLGGFGEEDSSPDRDLHIMLNMEWEDLDFEIPPLPDRGWYRVVDTARPTPDDFHEPEDAPAVTDSVQRVKSHSVVVLCSMPQRGV
jgi:glycogen operon protein